MEINNEKVETTDNNDNNGQNNENDISRKDSNESNGSNNDNESNVILKKEERTNNKIEIDSPIKNDNNQKIKKDNFFHDKDITEDSIIYFSNKLKKNNNVYKIYLYISIALYIIDIIIWLINNNSILHNIFHLISILTILISVIYQAYIFKNNFETISKELYNITRKIIYIYNAIAALFLINMLYIVYILIFNKDKKNKNNFFNNPLIVFIYVAANIYIPIIHCIKLFTIKKSIKNLSAAKGEIYESAEIEEIQIINSIVKES
jgi:hypothetical protein